MTKPHIHPRILDRCIKNQAALTWKLMAQRDFAVSSLERALTHLRELASHPEQLHVAAYIEIYETAIAQLMALDPADLPSENSVLAISGMLKKQVGDLTTQFGVIREAAQDNNQKITR